MRPVILLAAVPLLAACLDEERARGGGAVSGPQRVSGAPSRGGGSAFVDAEARGRADAAEAGLVARLGPEGTRAAFVEAALEAALDAERTPPAAAERGAGTALRAGHYDVDGPIRVTGEVEVDGDVAKSVVEFPLIAATDGTGGFTTGIAVYQQPEGACANLKLFGVGSSYGDAQAPGGGMLDIYQSKRRSLYQATVGPPREGEEAGGTYRGIPFTFTVAPVPGTDRARATMSGDGDGLSDLLVELPAKFAADVEVVEGVVFQAPGGARFRLSVSDAGETVWTAVD